jgi:hypothetical protein
MKRLWISGVLVSCVAVLGVCAFNGAPAQESTRRQVTTGEARPKSANGARPAKAEAGPERASVPDEGVFDGKLVALSLRGSTQPRLLERATFEQVHGRTFVVGKEVKATFSFPMGTQAHVAWDSVDSFYLFENTEEYEAAVRSALQGVQGTVDGVIGEFFPGAKVSGVNIACPPKYIDPNAPSPNMPTFDTPVPFNPDEHTPDHATTPRPVPDDQDSSASRTEVVPIEVSYVDAQGVERRETRMMRVEKIRRVVTDENGLERVVIEEFVEAVPDAGGETSSTPRPRAPTKRTMRWKSQSAPSR